MSASCTLTIIYWTNNEQITDESTFSDGGDVFVQRVVTRRVKKNWGVEVVEESVYDSDAPGAVPEVTSYDFYEIASQTNTYSKLKWRTNSDGTWDRYDYLPNGDTRTYRPWKDGPASPALATLDNSRSSLTSADGKKDARHLVVAVTPFSPTFRCHESRPSP